MRESAAYTPQFGAAVAKLLREDIMTQQNDDDAESWDDVKAVVEAEFKDRLTTASKKAGWDWILRGGHRAIKKDMGNFLNYGKIVVDYAKKIDDDAQKAESKKDTVDAESTATSTATESPRKRVREQLDRTRIPYKRSLLQNHTETKAEIEAQIACFQLEASANPITVEGADEYEAYR